MKLEDKVALVTGSARGIGKAISLAFAQEGANLVVADLAERPLKETCREISRMGRCTLPLVTDVSNEDQVNKLISQTVRRFGKIDVLVNNAGIPGPTEPVVNLAIEDWNRVFAVNLTGAFLCSKAALKHMVQRKSGNIINISSVTAFRALWGRSPYMSSKSALIGLTKTVALEVGIYGIRVNAICPGAVKGPRLDYLIEERAKATGVSSQRAREAILEEVILRRLLEPEEIARTALFLASSDSKGITGEIIRVDAGLNF